MQRVRVHLYPTGLAVRWGRFQKRDAVGGTTTPPPRQPPPQPPHDDDDEDVAPGVGADSDHTRRMKTGLLRAVQRREGQTYRELGRDLGWGNETVGNYVRLLRDARLLTTRVERGRHRVYLRQRGS